jgi:hypothetical protein
VVVSGVFSSPSQDQMMPKFNKPGIATIAMTVISIGTLIALLGGASWYKFVVVQKASGSTAEHDIAAYTFFLDKYQSSSSFSFNVNITSGAVSIVSSSTTTTSEATYTDQDKGGKTSCVNSGHTAMGLTIVNLILHVGFLALFFVKGGSFTDRNIKIAACSFGVVLQIAAVASFDTDSKCAKYIFDASSNLISNANFNGFVSIDVAA